MLASSCEHFSGVFRPLVLRESIFKERSEVCSLCGAMLDV